MQRSARRAGDPPMQGSRLLSGGVFLFIAISLANASNYLFQVVVSRVLGPADYSLVGGIFSVITVMGVSASSLQAASAKAIAVSRAAGAVDEHDELTSTAARWAVPVGMVLLAASPAIASFLHSGIVPVVALSLYALPAALLPVALGRLQGMEAFGAVAAISLALAIGRLVAAPLALALGLGVPGVVFSSVLVAIAVALAGLRLARAAGGVSLRRIRGDLARDTAALVLFWVIASIDVPVARHFLSPHDAGQYAAASVVGKAVLWLPGALSLIMFPRVASLRERGEETHPPLLRALGATIVLCTVAVAALRVVGPTVIPIFFGDAFRTGATQAWQVGLACLPLALANLVLFYHLTRPTRSFLIAPAIALVLEVAGWAFFHGSFHAIVVVIGAAGVILLAGLTVPGLRRRLRDHRARAASYAA